MQKVNLTDDQLNKVSSMVRAGDSWSKIQWETGISRYVAKREYKEWEAKQSAGKLSEARMVVAAEAYREHVNSMIALAEALTNHLRLPAVNDSAINADKFLDQLWKRNIISTVASPGVSGNSVRSDPLRNRRQNQMLLKALVAHTGDKVSWQSLDKWKASWNECVSNESKLRKEAVEMVSNYLEEEESLMPKLTENINKCSVYSLPLERMADAIIKQMPWWLEKEENGKAAYRATRIRSVGDATYVTLSDSKDDILKFNQANLAKVANHICNKVANELFIKHQNKAVASLRTEIQTMKEVKEEFEEILDPLVIRPTILRTRCDLCPA